jgi:hypothetical protein
MPSVRLPLLLALLLTACGGEALPPTTVPAAPRLLASVNTDTQAYTALMQYLYVAYFGRPADPDGLAFWSAALKASGVTPTVAGLKAAYPGNPGVRSIVDEFAASPEAKAMYGGDTSEFIAAIYRNLFSRDPDAAGKAFWTSAIDSGSLARGGAVLALMAGATGSDVDGIAAKAAFAAQFTAAQASDPRLASFGGEAAMAQVRARLNAAPVGNAFALQVAVEAAIAALAPPSPVANGGTPPVVEVPSGPPRPELDQLVHDLTLYFYGRAPSKRELDTVSGALAAAGGYRLDNSIYNSNPRFRAVIDQFVFSPEFAALYGTDNGRFVDGVYHNLFDRLPSPFEKSFWMDKLASGKLSKGAVGISVANWHFSFEDIADNAVHAAKLFAQTYFWQQLDTPAKQAAYDGAAAFALVRSQLFDKTTLRAGVPGVRAINDVIAAFTGAAYTPPNILEHSPAAAVPPPGDKPLTVFMQHSCRVGDRNYHSPYTEMPFIKIFSQWAGSGVLFDNGARVADFTANPSRYSAPTEPAEYWLVTRDYPPLITPGHHVLTAQFTDYTGRYTVTSPPEEYWIGKPPALLALDMPAQARIGTPLKLRLQAAGYDSAIGYAFVLFDKVLKAPYNPPSLSGIEDPVANIIFSDQGIAKEDTRPLDLTQDFNFMADQAPGTYTITRLTVASYACGKTVYDTAALKAMGVNTSFTLTR